MNNTTKSILRFICRCVAVTVPVIAVFAIWYFVSDPFKVLRHYNSYFPDPVRTPVRIGVNKGLITFTNLNDLRAAGHEPDAFIFGSSISCYYDAREWAGIIRETEYPGDCTVNPYHIDSSSESIISMARKAAYLDRNGFKIRYALIVLDPIIMNTETDHGPAFLDPPQLHDNILETLGWHYTFFRAATNADFFKSWWPAKISGIPADNGRNPIFSRQPIIYDSQTNQETMPEWDSLISACPDKFYNAHPLRPSPEHTVVSQPVLTPERRAALDRIAEIFRRQGTSCRIIIGPNRSKVTLNPSDLKILQTTFGADRVHDFSESMAGLLEADTLLYDNTHYRPPVARLLMNKAYHHSM